MIDALQERIDRAKAKAKTPESLGVLADGVLEAIRERQTVRLEQARIIDNSSCTDETGNIVIPDEISCLIDNKAYSNRHKYLIRNYGIEHMKKLAEIAKSKAKPSHWYAKATQRKEDEKTGRNWENYTLPMLERLFEKEARMKERLEKLGGSLRYLPFYLKAERILHFDVLEDIFEISLKKRNPDFYFRKCVKEELARLG